MKIGEHQFQFKMRHLFPIFQRLRFEEKAQKNTQQKKSADATRGKRATPRGEFFKVPGEGRTQVSLGSLQCDAPPRQVKMCTLQATERHAS
jgi:hypothetical protein